MNFKNYILILAIVNHLNWLDASYRLKYYSKNVLIGRRSEQTGATQVYQRKSPELLGNFKGFRAIWITFRMFLEAFVKNFNFKNLEVI